MDHDRRADRGEARAESARSAARESLDGLRSAVEATLGPDGAVARAMPAYEVRPQQIEMAGAVAEAFASDAHLVVEAGTGVGKSFAYLVPAIELAIREGVRVVISTHTITLQEQLIDKDIPFLQRVIPEPFSAVLVKGRSNYIGLRRLARTSARQEQLLDTRSARSDLWAIEQWAYRTSDGSLADLPRQPGADLWSRVNSDGDDCLGRHCPHHRRCFFQRARNAASGASLLIVNHALFFSDLALRKQGASVLPDYDFVVLDEAHTVESVAGDHLGVSVSAGRIRHLLNTLHNERTGRGLLTARDAQGVIPLVRDANQSLDRYCADLTRAVMRGGDRGGRLREPPSVDQPVSDGLTNLSGGLGELRSETSDEQDRLEIGGLMDRCEALATAVDSWHAQRAQECVYWLESDERTRRFTMHSRPLDVGPALRASLFDVVRSVVLTSATLTVSTGDRFGYIRRRLGLDETRCLEIGSPFDYRNQLTVYVVDDLPDPSDGEAFVPACCAAIRDYVGRTDGHAFVLFTSFDLLGRCAERLAPHFETQGMSLLVHGAGAPRSKLLESFRETPRSVLFGADSFWAGVDVPGDALQSVIIAKMPFAPPTQPMVQARIEQIRAGGGNPFTAYQLPEAILKFRQGVGRLIRTHRDRGMVVILDPRVRTRSYGAAFLRALPPGRIVHESLDRQERES